MQPVHDDFLREYESLRTRWLENYQNDLQRTSFAGAPPLLQEAILYSLDAGGKRLRPVLVLKAAETAGLPDEAARLVSTAFETLHTYSLVHDDLPAMDDDDLRRGKPSSHKKFGEDVAILVGDALQTLSFELLALAGAPSLAISMFAGLVGPSGMIGGQYLDIKAGERIFGTGPAGNAAAEKEKDSFLSYLEKMHREKTGRLIQGALTIPFVCANPEQDTSAIAEWSLNLGKLFQIMDDILDETADSQSLGKTAGKDRADGKLTYVNLLGLEEAQKLALALHDRLAGEAQKLFSGSNFYPSLVSYIYRREH